jgi:hypothetical protein
MAARRSGPNGRIDEQVAESFPASDPPAFAGGVLSIGAPRRKKAKAVKKPAAKKAAKKRK